MAENVTVKHRTIGDANVDTRILYDFIVLKLVKEKEAFLSYAQLNASIGGRDVQGDAYGMLRTARKRVDKDFHLLIETVNREGIKKSESVYGALERTIKHIGRSSRRTSKRVVNAMVDREMDDEQRIKAGIGLSVLGALEQFSKPKAQKLLEVKVRENQAKELPTAETLRLFAGTQDK